MGEDLETLSEDQVGRLVKKLCTKYLPGIIETKNQRLMALLQPIIVLMEMP